MAQGLYDPQPMATESTSTSSKELEPESLQAIKQEAAVEEEPEFQEGGRGGWLAVLGIWIIQFSTFGYTNAHGVYTDYYVREYMAGSATSFQISWIGSLQLMLVMSSGLFTGRLFDIGYYYHMMIGGSILFVFCIFMISLTHPGGYYQVFLAQGVGMGLGIGLTYIPGFSVLSHYFRRNRALAMGIASSGSGVGGAVQAIMLNKLFQSRLGFHNGVRISAAVNAVLLLAAVPMVRTRVPVSKNSSTKKTDILAEAKRFSRDVPYVMTVLGTFLVLCGLYFPFFFLQLNAITNGVDKEFARYVLTVLNAGSVIGRVGSTWLIPKLGVFNIVVTCIAISSGLIFCTFAVQTLAATMVFAILYGLSSGAYVGSLVPMVGSLAQSDSEIGARLGICFTFTGLGGLIGSPIAGALLTSSFHWWRPILFAGVCMAAGCVAFISARFLLMKSRRKKDGARQVGLTTWVV